MFSWICLLVARFAYYCLVFFPTDLTKFHVATDNGRVIPKWKQMNNNDEIYLNDVVMEEERLEENYEIQPTLQI